MDRSNICYSKLKILTQEVKPLEIAERWAQIVQLENISWSSLDYKNPWLSHFIATSPSPRMKALSCNWINSEPCHTRNVTQNFQNQEITNTKMQRRNRSISLCYVTDGIKVISQMLSSLQLPPKFTATRYELSQGKTLGDEGKRAVRTSTPVSVTYINTETEIDENFW